MNWRLPENPIHCHFFESALAHRSRFLASVRHLYPAGFPIPAGALGRPTSPHVSLYSSDKPNQQHCTHRSRSDWRSRRPHPYHRSLFTDFLHCGAANCGVGLQSVHYDRAPDFVDFGYLVLDEGMIIRPGKWVPVFSTIHVVQILWSGSVAASTIDRTSSLSKPITLARTVNSTTSIRRSPLSRRATNDWWRLSFAANCCWLERFTGFRNREGFPWILECDSP